MSRFPEEYPLGILISDKDKNYTFYDMLRDTCEYILQTPNPSEIEAQRSWHRMRSFVIWAIGSLELEHSQDIGCTFIDIFNHAGVSRYEFVIWMLVDVWPAVFDPTRGWALSIPDHLWQDYGKSQRANSRRKVRRSQAFAQDYLSRRGRMPTPSIQDLRLFAGEAIQLIDRPHTRERLLDSPLGRYGELLPQDIQKVVEDVSSLMARDARVLLDAKRLIENIRDEYGLPGVLEHGISKPEKPDMPELGSGLEVWLDYYHAMHRLGFKMTFKVLANESKFSESTFKQAHRRYKLERGIDVPND